MVSFLSYCFFPFPSATSTLINPFFKYIETGTKERLLPSVLDFKEIISLKSKTEGSNLSLIPVSMYLKNGFVKLEVALGRGKKKYDKKESIKKKDIQRNLDQELAS